MKRTPWLTHIALLLAFLFNSIGPLPSAQADEFILPKPGVMVHLSPEFNPPMLKGIKVYPDNPFRFDFVLDQGDSTPAEALAKAGSSNQEQLKTESTKLIKYFLASLTIPEKDLWVNLSPYEKDRIVPESFGQTEMGRDLLAQDYMLKQITASLIYPEDEVGKKFWKRVYEEAQKKYGTTQVPVNTFNKVWIVPEKAVVYENAKAGTAYVVESKLKVMLEQDYLALEKGIRGHVPNSQGSFSSGIRYVSPNSSDVNTNAIGSQIIREIVIPELEKEVNQGKNFAQLRQVYQSLILAIWYKKKIKDSILTEVYSNKNLIAGINIDNPKDKEKIYQQYLQAFKKGVYNYIKEEQDVMTQEPVSKKYFSGGITDLAMNIQIKPMTDSAMMNFLVSFQSVLSLVSASLSFSSRNESSVPVVLKRLGDKDPLGPELDVRMMEEIKGRLKHTKTYEVGVGERKFIVKAEIDGKVVVYSFYDKGKPDERVGFIYTQENNKGEMAIAGLKVYVEKEDIAKMMVTLLVKYIGIEYFHRDKRNAVLIRMLVEYFNFQPTEPVKPNAYYLRRTLSVDEIRRLGYEVDNFPKGKISFLVVSKPLDLHKQRLLGAAPQEIKDQYLAIDRDKDIFEGMPGVIPFYVGVELKKPEPVQREAGVLNRAMSADEIIEGLRKMKHELAGEVIGINDAMDGEKAIKIVRERILPYAAVRDQDILRDGGVGGLLTNILNTRAQPLITLLFLTPEQIKLPDDRQLIAKADEFCAVKFLLENPEEIRRLEQEIGGEKIRPPNSSAMIRVQENKKATIFVANRGGIDLTPANNNLETSNNGGQIKFHLDSAMLAQFKNAPGFEPVIINIQPMPDLKLFLGLTDEVPTNVAS